MRWKKFPSGKVVWKNDRRYRIDFQKPSRSKEQFQVKQFIAETCPQYVWYEEYHLPGSLLRTDFLCPTLKIALEHQGAPSHWEFNVHFHAKSREKYLASIRRD